MHLKSSVAPVTPVAPGETRGPKADELAVRMAGPQRYRLLQGFPMPQMMPARGSVDALEAVRLDHSRPLIVGVLPHSSCAPAVAGCGFCTFPHEAFGVSRVKRCVASVIEEIAETRARRPELFERRVEAVYLGGGTANLTPPESLGELCRALAGAFSLDEAEVTLEGAPVFFREPLLDVMGESLPTRRLRLSMGIQTFDPEQIRAMGRQAFGDRESIGQVVALAQRRGFTTSGDFLLNLPGQSLEGMLADASCAVGMGLDQICLYHLVLFRGLATPWARDAEKLRALPDLARAEANWARVREFLLGQGYVQTSLTNFERPGPRPYVYEDCSFHPETYDAIGFGPSALSTFSDGSGAVKTMNFASTDDYVGRQGSPVSHQFLYGLEDLKLLYLTRKLSRLVVPRGVYARTYGSDLVADFAEEMGALEEAGLVEVDSRELRLTARGIFYADSVAGLLASRRVRQLRLGRGADDANSARAHFMG